MNKKLFFHFEHYKQPLASKKRFVIRMLRCITIAFLLMTIVLSIATTVYHNVEALSWLDAQLNSVMIMTGLGLINNLHTSAGKVFTSFFSIFSAIVFYMFLAIIFSPLIHRFLHKFYLDTDRNDD